MPHTRYFLREDNYNAYYDFRMHDHIQRARVVKTYEARYWDLYDACADDPVWAKKEEKGKDIAPQMAVEPPEPALPTVGAGAAVSEEDYQYDSEEDCFVKIQKVRVSPRKVRVSL